MSIPHEFSISGSAANNSSVPFTRSKLVGNQPLPQWHATGKGFNNDPRVPFAGMGHQRGAGNLKLTNLEEKRYGVNSHLKIFWGFATEVSTSWSLSGERAQAQLHRTFYPKHVKQGKLVVAGVCPSQYEYDKLVEFVRHHHATALTNTTEYSAVNQKAVGLQLLRSRNQASKRLSPEKFHCNVIIDGIEAGHQRFVHAPTFVLNCTVVHDFLQKNYQAEDYLVSEMQKNYIQQMIPSGIYRGGRQFDDQPNWEAIMGSSGKTQEDD